MFLLAEGIGVGLINTRERPWPLSAVLCSAATLTGLQIGSFSCLLLYFGVLGPSGGYLGLSPADCCKVLGKLQECFKVFRLSK